MPSPRVAHVPCGGAGAARGRQKMLRGATLPDAAVIAPPVTDTPGRPRSRSGGDSGRVKEEGR